jgi:hypothetical protein
MSMTAIKSISDSLKRAKGTETEIREDGAPSTGRESNARHD